MERKLSIENIIIFIIFLAFSTAKARRYWGEYDYYKIALSWPESYCNAHRTRSCIRPVKNNFTIHGVWPMYFFNTMVDEYNLSGCTNTTPTEPQFITRQLLFPILNEMDEYWPNLKDSENLTENEQFWQYQWRLHGRCFDYPIEPLLYFQTGLSLMSQLDLLHLLKEANIFPDYSYGYQASVIKAAIESRVGEQVQIGCNTPREGWPTQFHEVAVCFDRDGDVMRCPFGYFNCIESDMIQFPDPLVYN